jgi:hypothetical protein
MNKKELVKNLIKDIQDIYTIANRFDNPENIHSIDIDLALSKVRNLYELLLKLNPQGIYRTEYQKEEISTITKQEESKKAKEESVEVEKQINKPQENSETIDFENIKESPAKESEIAIETPVIEEKQKEQKPIEDKPSKKTAEIKQNGISPEIVADRFHSKTFVHDNISRKNTKKDVSSKMQSKPITDINSAIGLNDKFIFIRELFGNNKEHYIETIQVLNNFDTFENAVNFLDENFDWDAEDPNYERLKELVRRKYSAK